MTVDTACHEHARYCTWLLSRDLRPSRRDQLQREERDWRVLADQQRTWRAVEADERVRLVRVVSG